MYSIERKGYIFCVTTEDGFSADYKWSTEEQQLVFADLYACGFNFDPKKVQQAYDKYLEGG